jgi:SAM-dependent methyltransferase
MYKSFAKIYDKLIYDVDYEKWADYIELIFKNTSVKPESIFDLGCGTGSFCLEMFKRGFDMIGADLSTEMLSEAKNKIADANADILLLNQGMTEFELFGTVDIITCLLDTFNYLTHKKDVIKMLKLVKNYLNPGGLFIFDINSDYKLKNLIGNNVFYDVDDEVSYIWQNEFDKKTNNVRFELTFFVKNTDTYTRYDEVHYERAYSNEEIILMIIKSGLELVSCYEAFSLSPPKSKSERIFFVCRKIK